MNIQYVISDGNVYVIESKSSFIENRSFLVKNHRSSNGKFSDQSNSRSKSEDLGYKMDWFQIKKRNFVKVPVFSFSKLTRVDVTLGSRNEIYWRSNGQDSTLEKALYKGLIGAGRKVPLHGSILFTIDDVNKPEAAKLAKDSTISVSKFGQPEELLDILTNSISQPKLDIK